MIQHADVMIVLGRVDNKGRLTIDAHERIRYAAELYHQGLVSTIVAPAKWSYKLKKPPKTTEAATIKAQLIKHGVPAGAVLLEEKSCDTLGGAYFLKVDFVQPHNWRKIIVVTSKDHLKRTKYVFHKVFGRNFDLQYVHGNCVLDETAFRTSLERERRSYQLMKNTWVGPIVPGRHSMVEAIFRMHPGYNPQATLTAEDIEHRVRMQSAR